MAEVKYRIVAEADLAAITDTAKALDSVTKAEDRAKVAAKELAKAERETAAATKEALDKLEAYDKEISKTTLEQYNLDSATVGTARAMGQAEAATTKAAKAISMAEVATVALGRAFTKLKTVLFGIAFGAIIAAVSMLGKWLFELVTGLEKAEKALEDVKTNADEAAAAKRRMADGTREAKAALDEELASIKAIEDQQNKALKRAKDFEFGKGGTLTESQKIEQRKKIGATFDAAIAAEEAAKGRIGGTPEDAARREGDADRRIAFLREARARRIRAVDSPATLTEDQRRNKEFQIEREFADKEANVALTSQEAQLKAAQSPIAAARARQAEVQKRFDAGLGPGETQQDRARVVEELEFAKYQTRLAEREFGPTVSTLQSSIFETRADAASKDQLLRAQQEVGNQNAEQTRLLKEQEQAIKENNEVTRRTIRELRSQVKNMRD